MSTKQLGRNGMERSDKKALNNVQNNSVLRRKIITSWFSLPPPTGNVKSK